MGYVIVCGRALCVLFCFVLFGELFVCFFNYFLHFGLFSGFDMLTKFVSTTSTNMFSRASLVIWAEGFDLLGRGGGNSVSSVIFGDTVFFRGGGVFLRPSHAALIFAFSLSTISLCLM